MASFAGNNDGRTGLGVAVVCVAQFVVVLDVTIVATALPTAGAALGFATADLHWVITGYTLVFSGFLIPGGRLADVLGRRRAFMLGLGGFVVASAGCALAWSPAALVLTRLTQGVAAALLAPAALALLTMLTDAGASRRRAVGVWTATAASGGATGWVLGGLLTEVLGWPWVFWINLPIGLTALAAAVHVLPRTKGRSQRIDVVGAIGVTTALSALVYGLAHAGAEGALATKSWAPAALAAVLTVAFVRRERNLPYALLPESLLRSRPILTANVAALSLTATTTPAMFLAILYVQRVLELSPARASVLFPAFNVAVVVGSLVCPRLMRSLTARVVLAVGFIGIGCGTAVLTSLSPSGAVTSLLAAFALMGLGLGVASVGSTHIGTQSADPALRGVAGGALTAAAQVGTALGLATVTPMATAVPDAASLRAGFLATCGIAALGGVSTTLLASGRARAAANPTATAITGAPRPDRHP
jgi:MFS family permease